MYVPIKKLLTKFVYLLAVQKCSKERPYTIHGLWVDYINGGYPEFCHKAEFSKEPLMEILPDLKMNWPSCYGGSDEGLWKHEFLKHATCMEKNLTEFDYFNKTLELFHKRKADGTFEKKCHNKHECKIEIDKNDIYIFENDFHFK